MTIEGRDAQGTRHILSSNKDLLPFKITLKMSKVLVSSTRYVEFTRWAPPQILRPKCAKYDRASHLPFEVWKLSHVSNYIYAKSSLVNTRCPKVKLNGWCEHKGRFFFHECQQIFHFYQDDIFDVQAKFTLEWHPLIGVNTLARAPNRTKTMTTSLFGIVLHVLIIFKLQGACVYGHIRTSALILIIFWLWRNEVSRFNLGKKSSINQKMVAWEFRG